jgi:PAS domain S-box-containing protein
MHRKINILLVEDNPGDAFLIKQMLAASDFSSASLLTASTLKEALAYREIEKEIPLILLDLGLPDSDGMESVRTVRKHFPDAALNVLTGLSDKKTASDALREGVQNYLVKGEIDSAELEEAIRYSLERHNFISKLKEAHQSLKQSEEKYKLLFRNNPMPMWIIDYKNDLSFMDVNDAALSHYGYTREEFLSMTSIDIRPAVQKERYIKMHRTPQDGPAYSGIWQHVKKDGTIIDVEIRTHDIIFDNRDARLVLANDITEKLKAEEKLIASEVRYRRLFEAAKDGILILNPDTGTIDDVNPFLMDMLGYLHTEFLGKQLWEIGLFRDIIANKSAFIELKKERYIRYENLPLKTKDGRAIWVEFVSNAYDVGGKQVIQCNIRDITERKKAEEKTIRSEERYKDLVENITDLICTHDMDGWILSANKAAEKIMGYSFNSEKKMNIKDILSPDKKDGFDTYMVAIKEHGHAEGLMKVLTDKGELRIWEFQNTLKSDGAAPIVRGFARDITERRKAEALIKESNKELQELAAHLQTIREEERAHLAREVHDVLGQQITGLKMDMIWLNKRINNKDETMEERFKEMLLLADEMVKTVRKISSELRPGILDDLGLVAALEWQSNEFEKRTGVECLFPTLPSLPDISQTTATGIFRIYQETLTNVARHAEATRVSASITADTTNIKLTVADNGRGLDVAEMKSKKTLGLVGMRERAAMMGGKLTVETRMEGGTLVTLLVPVQKKTDA